MIPVLSEEQKEWMDKWIDTDKYGWPINKECPPE